MAQILIVGPSWVGDMVMAQSLFITIRQQSPETKITVLAPGWSEPILQRMSEVDGVIDMPVGHGRLQLGVRRKLAKTIRHYKFDQAIVLPGSLKSALIPWLAGIPKRTGFVGEQRWGLLNDIRRLNEHALPRNVQRYVSLGFDKNDSIPENPPNPKLSADQDSLVHTLKVHKLKTVKPVLVLCPGAEFGPAKRWPAKYYAEVARSKLAKGWQVWILGSEKDGSIAEYINDLAGGKCINLSGQTSLGEVVDLMSLAKFVVTNDSGLMHVAAAVGSHVIAIYGSSSDKFTPPLTPHSDRLKLDLECSPCFKRECPLGHMNCLNQLKPERVLNLID